MKKYYVRLCRGLKDFGVLIPEEEVPKRIDTEHDWYQSVYYYNQEQYDKFQQVKSVKGMRDVWTNKLIFDFDSKQDLELSKLDAMAVCNRLRKAGVKDEAVELYFSGGKGFHVIVNMIQMLRPDEAAELAKKYTIGLDTFDPSLYDCSQVLRVPNTKHQTTGLYKIALCNQDLQDTSEKIKIWAKEIDSLQFRGVPQDLSPRFFELPKEEAKPKKAAAYKLNLKDKPSHWRNCKWSLLQGNFGADEGERHNALMILAATCRGLRYDKETTYQMCKAAIHKQAKLHGREKFAKTELWNNIITDSIFVDGWSGGQYSCKTHPWLSSYCKSLGEFGCKDHEEEPAVYTLSDMEKKFLDYAVNHDSNTIKMGIADIDDHVTLYASSLNGLLGNPGAGKTACAINFLNNTSKAGVDSMFFSLDMGLPLIYAKLAQKKTGHDFKTVMKMFRESKETAAKLAEEINSEYKNVVFNFKSGLTVADMGKSIKEYREISGKSPKLIIVDYLECLVGPYSDPIANTGIIANQLKDLANEFSACVLLLLQTQKHSTPDVSDPLLSLKGVKGSSVIEQSCSTILTLWREGYSPETVEEDRYISFSVVKNRFGSLWKGDFSWDGVTGNIRSLTEEERDEFKQFQNEKKLRRLQALKDAKFGDVEWR